MKTRATRSLITLVIAGTVVILGARPTRAAEPLYPAQGIRAEAVRQGIMGSCYFHSSIAAIANTDPNRLASAIQPVGANYRVRFSDGYTELVRPEDVAYARQNGYDRSDGLWVAVLFRGYGQRVLREALMLAIDNRSFSPLLKGEFERLIASTDLPLLAYDRAIRSQIDQAGSLSADSLRYRIDQEVGKLPLPSSAKAVTEQMLTSKGILDSASAMVEENGEVFGAYRAAGQGGLPERVLMAFGGSGHSLQKGSSAQVRGLLSSAQAGRHAVVAATSPATFEEVKKLAPDLPGSASDWYTPEHAYTVLEFDGNNVTLRNPWADHPHDSRGIFKLPIDEFMAVFPYLFFQ